MLAETAFICLIIPINGSRNIYIENFGFYFTHFAGDDAVDLEGGTVRGSFCAR